MSDGAQVPTVCGARAAGLREIKKQRLRRENRGHKCISLLSVNFCAGGDRGDLCESFARVNI